MTAVEWTSPKRAAASARLALRVLQAGAIAVVLVASTWRAFDLDRFLAPKELAFHLAAALAGLLLLRRMSRTATMPRVDLLLGAFAVWSALSAVFSTNPWLAGRALAVTISSIVVFRAARAIGEAGLARPLLTIVAVAVVLAAFTSLLQAYGVRLDIFSINRSPGGTLGNRNFVGHAAAFGLPVVLLAALRARRLAGFLLGATGVAIVTAALVLTRSRAAWLAAAAVVVIALVAPLLSRALRGSGRTWARMLVLAIAAAGAVVAALAIPNTLRWNSDNPYLESVRGVTSYDEGSGRGRLVQYQRSLRMSLSHPLFGVGPGNWPVVYPAFAKRNDPSMDPNEGGVTSNPWPSSDWIAFLSERGFPGAALILLAFVHLALHAFRRLRTATETDDALASLAMLGTIAGACAAGAFDAVLLLALPAYLVWTALGALAASPLPAPVLPVEPIDTVTPPAPSRHHVLSGLMLLVLVVLSGIGALRSVAQLVVMDIYATRGDRASLERAAQIDPGNYRLRLRLARVARKSERCDHARAAHALFPEADAAAAAARSCGSAR